MFEIIEGLVIFHHLIELMDIDYATQYPRCVIFHLILSFIWLIYSQFQYVNSKREKQTGIPGSKFLFLEQFALFLNCSYSVIRRFWLGHFVNCIIFNNRFLRIANIRKVITKEKETITFIKIEFPMACIAFSWWLISLFIVLELTMSMRTKRRVIRIIFQSTKGKLYYIHPPTRIYK